MTRKALGIIAPFVLHILFDNSLVLCGKRPAPCWREVFTETVSDWIITYLKFKLFSYLYIYIYIYE